MIKLDKMVYPFLVGGWWILGLTCKMKRESKLVTAFQTVVRSFELLQYLLVSVLTKKSKFSLSGEKMRF